MVLKRVAVPAGVAGVIVLLALAGSQLGQAFLGGFRLPPVCQAMVAGDFARAERLVRRGADVHAGHGCALTGAAGRGRLDLVALLLDKGADPNRKITGEATVYLGAATPLAAAVQSRDLEVVDLLLRRGADPREDFEAFRTVLNFGDVELAELLLAHGADPDMASGGDEPAYSYLGDRQVEVARAELAPERLDATAQRYNCNVSGPESLLHYALSPGTPGPAEAKQRIAAVLIAHGADPDARTPMGATPLMFAASWHQHAAMRMLLDVGADSAAVDRCGRTASDYVDLYPRRPEAALAAQTRALLEGAGR